jgi:hypothetical protein
MAKPIVLPKDGTYDYQGSTEIGLLVFMEFRKKGSRYHVMDHANVKDDPKAKTAYIAWLHAELLALKPFATRG